MSPQFSLEHGHFNIRLGRADDPNLTDLLGCNRFVNRVTAPTHRLGVMLDVVVTRQDLTAPDVEVVDVGLSDHSLLRWSASSARPTPVIETFFCRPWHSLEINDFRSVLLSSALCQPVHCSLDPDKMASLYDTELAAILDHVIPARTVTHRPRMSDPWFDEECRTAKRLTRRLERAAAAAAKRSDATDAASANQAWQTQRRAYRILRNQKRDAFWSNTVADNQSSTQQLWRSVDLLLGRGRAPASSPISVDQFRNFSSTRSRQSVTPPLVVHLRPFRLHQPQHR